MDFTPAEIEMLAAALPGFVSPHRKALLSRVLQEWGRTDLDEHLTRVTREQVRAERRRMKRVVPRASELATALSDLGPDASFAVAQALASNGDNAGGDAPPYEQIIAAAKRLEDDAAELHRLARAASDAAASWVPLPQRDVTLIRYRVLQDLAAIFEWATGERAERRVRAFGDDAGKAYGPFWDFASIAWTLIFKPTDALEGGFKNWATARNKYLERSPFIGNLVLRHPQWRILEQ